MNGEDAGALLKRQSKTMPHHPGGEMPVSYFDQQLDFVCEICGEANCSSDFCDVAAHDLAEQMELANETDRRAHG